MGTDDDGWLLRGSGDVDDVREYYDRWAEGYDEDLSEWSYEAPAVAGRLLLDQLGPIPESAGDGPGDVLDAGCGTGLVGVAMRAAGFSGRLVGVDVSAASLRVAERTGAYDAVRPADLQSALEFGDDGFDGLVCVGVMTYVPDVGRCWREFARVVRPGGVIVVTQREDLWLERRCPEIIDALESDHVWAPLQVTGPQPYLPGNDDYADRIGVHYVSARVT